MSDLYGLGFNALVVASIMMVRKVTKVQVVCTKLVHGCREAPKWCWCGSGGDFLVLYAWAVDGKAAVGAFYN